MATFPSAPGPGIVVTGAVTFWAGWSGAVGRRAESRMAVAHKLGDASVDREVLADADHEFSADGRRELLEQNYRVHTTTPTGEVA